MVLCREREFFGKNDSNFSFLVNRRGTAAFSQLYRGGQRVEVEDRSGISIGDRRWSKTENNRTSSSWSTWRGNSGATFVHCAINNLHCALNNLQYLPEYFREEFPSKGVHWNIFFPFQCPFARIIYIFDYKNTSFLKQLQNEITAVNATALELMNLPEHIIDAALSTYKLSEYVCKTSLYLHCLIVG
jgi:hypothetical protein